MSLRHLLTACTILVFAHNLPAEDAVKPVPPPGVAVPDADREELTKGAAALGTQIAELRKKLAPEVARKGWTARPDEVPNVEIFHKAVDWALRYNEFFDAKQIDTARQLLKEGDTRATELKLGRMPWNQAPGLVVRGYRSQIDGSVQPYGLVLPDDWKPDEKTPRPLHFWCHGRGETLSELAFINDRMHNKGEFTPPGAIVCHLYGRFCCANKFAGESDLFEALEDIRKHYAIDMQRLVIRGFSMGGASTWQFGTHFSGTWAAVAPGAGFGETAEFFHVFGPGKTPPPWWEQVLWRWYDSTTMAANLANTKTVAYSGEIDGQKQAADIMIKYAKEEGIEIPHIIGPQTPHRYHPDSKPKIEEFITEAVKEGNPPLPRKAHLTTYSLIYPDMKWLHLTGMEHEWERADLDGEIDTGGVYNIKTKNVTAFYIGLPQQNQTIGKLVVDGNVVSANVGKQFAHLHREGTAWKMGQVYFDNLKRETQPASLHKEPTVCGPIDHAFMSKFIFVRPTNHASNPTTSAWAEAELKHATEFWRKVFRGDVTVKDDMAVTAEDIESSNLVIWGDPTSNAYLAALMQPPKKGTHAGEPLPLQWTESSLVFKGIKYDATTHMPILVFPNPMNPKRYIVLNSGPTFREEALLNNSDQTPKLPDWAIVDVRTPPDAKWPGLVEDAGFFDEQWKP